ncbi:MAG: hydroxyacyl-ACP dehydratase HTD2-like protein with hotdog domain [Glaciecola sp.]|jgi:hydroxyacyl-ACP dehydratase HTD2-like protein with hotdog domain|uniref:FAS1-like dehydratase domain-containing protein n=1 Tax=Congregibacter sp. TaxID=2744308 RepID=UPI0039E314FB
MSGVLNDSVLSAIGRRSEPRREIVTRRDIRKYAVATGNRQPKYLDGDEAPPMFHVSLFWDVVELDQLTPDGVSIDTLLPKFPLEKAMAGGLHLEYHRPVHPGDWLTATRTLTNIYEKAGRSGALIFYEVVMEIVNDIGDPVITEKTTRILR